MGAEAAPSTQASELEPAESPPQRSLSPSAPPLTLEQYRTDILSMKLPASKEQLLRQIGELHMRANDEGPSISGDKELLLFSDEQFATVCLSFLAWHSLPEVVVVRSLMRHGP